MGQKILSKEFFMQTESTMTPQIKTEKIYVKYITYKVPQAPQFFIHPDFQKNWEPAFSFEMHMKHHSLSEDRHEITLYATVSAKTKQNSTALVIEVQQSGIFSLVGFSKEQLPEVMSSACVTSLYPYLCRTVNSASVDAGFPSVLLSPLSFNIKNKEAETLETMIKTPTKLTVLEKDVQNIT